MTFGFPGVVPHNAKHMAFILKYVELGEVKNSAVAVGYSKDWGRAHGPKVLEQHHDLVAWLQASRAQKVAQVIGVDQQMVLEEMVRIAFANEADYIVIEDTEQKDGTLLKKARRKRVEELTREQLAAVVVIGQPGRGNNVSWRWRDRDGMLQIVAKHLGMLNEKIIMEHRHRHLHVQFDLSKVPMKRLEDLEGEFEALLGEEGNAQKG